MGALLGAARPLIGLDTNVLVRYLVEDDRAQTDRAQRLLAAAKAAGEFLYLSIPVLCETVWVLSAVYGKGKNEILDTLATLLSTDVFEVETADAVRKAIEQARGSRGDFADHLIGELNLARGCRHTVTFDRSLKGWPAFSQL